MKYIRTKDGIFRIDNDEISVVNGCQFVSISGGILHALEIKDKVADTIEELCDYWDFYDLLDNEYKIKAINLYSVGVMRASLERKTARDIKLVIRTGKSLIYVAKMNDKGELELL